MEICFIVTVAIQINVENVDYLNKNIDNPKQNKLNLQAKLLRNSRKFQGLKSYLSMVENTHNFYNIQVEIFFLSMMWTSEPNEG